jgi:hypothetical protein
MRGKHSSIQQQPQPEARGVLLHSEHVLTVQYKLLAVLDTALTQTKNTATSLLTSRERACMKCLTK